jgi:hypothetical protein
MSRQLEQHLEIRQAKRVKAITAAVEYELYDAISHSGGELTGLAFKFRQGDVLMVLKVVLAGRDQVAFVGAEDMGGCLIKGVREARKDGLRWREDLYGGES